MWADVSYNMIFYLAVEDTSSYFLLHAIENKHIKKTKDVQAVHATTKMYVGTIAKYAAKDIRRRLAAHSLSPLNTPPLARHGHDWTPPDDYF